jgi:hypothetical protein
LGPGVKDFLGNVLKWFENWVVVLDGPAKVEQVQKDLFSAIACARVGQPMLNVFMSNMHI